MTTTTNRLGGALLLCNILKTLQRGCLNVASMSLGYAMFDWGERNTGISVDPKLVSGSSTRWSSARTPFDCESSKMVARWELDVQALSKLPSSRTPCGPEHVGGLERACACGFSLCHDFDGFMMEWSFGSRSRSAGSTYQFLFLDSMHPWVRSSSETSWDAL